MLHHEYEWVRQTRKILLDYCKEINPVHLNQLNGFGWQSIRDTFVHTADCYVAWLGSFVLLKTKKPLTPKEELNHYGLEEITLRFEQVDKIVMELLEHHGHNLNVQIEREIPWREASERISITPGKLLAHAITHEFHHKGQIAAMLREMGYEPPNTDILGTDD
ncbi:DinB family protein [Metabacillus sp. FJAT-52054]|uniref:DinB family protein n=1 Tax=Metabacillus sediminis TaxID=3117746 RepID=A0ABZ2NKC8_9BACI